VTPLPPELAASENPAAALRVWTGACALLVLCLLIAYGAVLDGVLVWDDTYVVEQNLMIRDPANLRDLVTRAYFDRAETGHYTRSGEQSYRPLVTLSHFLDHALFGDRAGGYHAMSLLYHLGACGALAWLLVVLGAGRAGAFAGALLFGLHPVLSEAVVVVSYRDDILAAGGVCAACALHLRGRRWAAGGAFLAAALAKQSAVVFLPLVMMADLLRVREADRARSRGSWRAVAGAAWRAQWRAWLGYGTATGLYLLLVLWLMTDPTVGATSYPGGSWGSGMATSARAVARYMSLVVAPVGLQVDPYFPPSVSGLDPWALASAAAVAAGIVAAAWLPGGWPGRFLGLWFFVALVPVAGFYPLPNYFAERYLYLPMMGACGLGAWAWERLRRRWNGPEGGGAAVIWVALSLVATSFVMIDRARARMVSSDEAFFEEMIRANPRSSKGYEGLGSALFDQGRTREASEAWEQAVSRAPESAIAHHNLGLAYLRQNRRAAALGVFNRALQLQPGFVESRYQRAVLMREDGDPEGAEQEQRRVLELNPNFIPAKFQLAFLLDQRGEVDAALRLYQEIVAVHPNYAKAWKNLGVIHLSKRDDPALAARYFRRYLALVPNDPRAELMRKVINEAGEE